MTIEKPKNTVAAELGRRGGEARAANLSREQRVDIAKLGGMAALAKKRDRPPVHEVIKMMLAAVERTGKRHTFYMVDGFARFCEVGSSFDSLWMMMPENCVGTYGPGAQFTDILSDVLST